MFKKSYLISILLIAMLILAACSSTSNQETVENEEENTNGEEVNKNKDEGNIEDEDEEDKNLSEDVNSNEEEENAENEGNNDSGQTHDEESDDFAANSKQVDSDEQAFSIKILPDYSLTSEEPGRDSLYLTEDGNIFMRIETLPADDEAYDYYNENIVLLLEAISLDGNTPTEFTDENKLPQGEDIEKAVGYTVDTPEGIVSGIVFEKDGLAIRLTMFDTPENNHYDQFLKMGETIISK